MNLSIRTVATALAVLGLGAPPAFANGTSYSIGLAPAVPLADYTAAEPCRTRVHFVGTVTFGDEAPAGDLTYHIRYSDGVTGNDTVVKHQASGLSSQTMDIRTFFAPADGWAELEFTSPEKITTVRRDFHVTCPAPANSVTVSKGTVSIVPAPRQTSLAAKPRPSKIRSRNRISIRTRRASSRTASCAPTVSRPRPIRTRSRRRPPRSLITRGI